MIFGLSVAATCPNAATATFKTSKIHEQGAEDRGASIRLVTL